MTQKQQELRRLLDLTTEVEKQLAQAFRDGAEAVAALWIDEAIRDLADNTGDDFAESIAWTGRVMLARDEVIAEFEN